MYLCLSEDTFSCYTTWTLEEMLTHAHTHSQTCTQAHFRVHRHKHAHTARLTGCISTITLMPFPNQQWQLWAPFDHRDRAVPLGDWDEATYFDCQTKIHQDPYRCCFTDKSMNASHPPMLQTILFRRAPESPTNKLSFSDESNSIWSFLGTIESLKTAQKYVCFWDGFR